MKKIKVLMITLLLILVESIIPFSTAKASENASLALIEVKDYSIDGGMLAPGSEINLNLTLHNTSTTSAATNVYFSFVATNNFLYPVYGTDNQVYVGTISANGEAKVSIPLAVSSSFGGEYISVTCNFSYVTGNFKQDNSASIVIPSSGGNKIAVKSVDVASHAVVGGRSLISLKYSNHTNEDIVDAVLAIDGNISALNKEIAIDTISSNKDYLNDFYVCFIEDGIQSITISLKYSDASGTQYIEEIGTYSVSVSKAIDASTEENRSSVILYYEGLGIMALAGLIALIVVIRYAKKHF